MTKFDPFAQSRQIFEARADRWEDEGVDARDIFHTFAQVFGLALSRYCEPDVAVAFLKQEIGRIEAMARTQTTTVIQ